MLGHPSLREILGFDFALLCERYLAPFVLARQDPSLLQRTVAFLSATGDVLHYGHVEALRDRVFLRPQWLVDCMAALVRHDLEPRLAALGDDSLLPDGLTAEQAQAFGQLFVSRGILDKRLLPVLWADLQPDVTAEPGLLDALVALMVTAKTADPMVTVPWAVRRAVAAAAATARGVAA